MTSRLYRYVPHHKVDAYLRRGWKRTGGLQWSHHGFHAELMVSGGWWAMLRARLAAMMGRRR